jgi:isopenicillin N synthase-like dioxygenase
MVMARTPQSLEIPRIDLGDMRTMDDFIEAAQETERKKRLGHAIIQAYHTVGFAFVRAPRDLGEQLDDMYNDAEKFFALQNEEKMQIWGGHHKYQRGFTGVNTEQALFCKRVLVEGEDQRRPIANYAENLFFAPEGIENSSMAAEFEMDYLPNVYPDQVPTLRQHIGYVHEALLAMDKYTMLAAEPILLPGGPEGYFADRNGDSPSLLRLLHYPPAHQKDVESGAVVGACQHTDINDRTWLPRSRSHGPGRGLEVRTRQGDWISGKAPEGYVITQVGDMFQHSTGGYFLSAQHRVEAPIIENGNKLGRFSCALFIHPRSDVDLGEVMDLSHLGHSAKHVAHVTAHDKLHTRLDNIGLA